MENLFFLRIEIIFFLISTSYLIYYIFYQIKKYTNKNNRTVNITKSDKTTFKKTKYKKEKEKEINGDIKLKISEILRKETIFFKRGDFESAKSLIIEGLALDKNNKQLNLELANIYNKQLEYKKSEYIYRELIEKEKDDFDLLKKLGFILALQKKYKESIKIYKKILEQKKDEPGIIDILSDLTFEVKDFKSCIKFAKLTLKNKPRNVEKMQLLAYSYDHLGELEKSLTYYLKIIELQPSNEKILQRINEIKKTLSDYIDVEKIKHTKK